MISSKTEGYEVIFEKKLFEEMKNQSLLQLILSAITKGLIHDGYCEKYKSFLDSNESRIFRTIHIDKKP